MANINKVIGGLVLSFFVTFAVAQENERELVPANVIASFNKLHPEERGVTWRFDEPNFEASFKLNGRAVSLLFDENGCVTEEKNEIMLFELPVDVSHMLSREYSGWKIDKASFITASGTSYYETVVEKEKKTVVLVFNRRGGLVAKMVL